MREIKFRGFHEHKDGETVITINGEKKRGTWVYGVPIKTKIGIFIIDEENPHYCSQYFYMEIQVPKLVIPETVGQFIGLKDKNGKEIYDGDVVRSADGYITAVVKIGSCYPEPVKKFCELMGIREHSIYCLHAYDKNGEYLIEDNKSLEIIGNIYENPKLMEGNNG